MTAAQTWTTSNRLAGLRRFAAAITLLNVPGPHGFRIRAILGAAAGFTGRRVRMEILLALAGKWAAAALWLRKDTIDFLLPAHITGLAVAMLLYANDRLWPIAFASAAAIGSKAIFRLAPAPHAPLFQSFELRHYGDAAAVPLGGHRAAVSFHREPAGCGLLDSSRRDGPLGHVSECPLTHKLPLIGAWLGCFALQALSGAGVRHAPSGCLAAHDRRRVSALYLLHGHRSRHVAGSRRGQIFFGLAVAFTYAMLMMAHVVFGLFFSLTLVCACAAWACMWEARQAMAQRGPSEGYGKLNWSPSPPEAAGHDAGYRHRGHGVPLSRRALTRGVVGERLGQATGLPPHSAGALVRGRLLLTRPRCARPHV